MLVPHKIYLDNTRAVSLVNIECNSDRCRALLFEAIMNLIDNAMKFTPSGGAVDVRLTCDASGPCIAIVDDGPGIPTDDIHLVMQPFYRSTAVRSVPGSGVGLSVVGAIVNLHKFRFDISSGPIGTSAFLRCLRDH